MSQDKEREIQLQFLEEAQEYLDTIESVLLGLASSHIDGQQMDAVLRAAHSVKGGAGMMGYQTLSQLAHRLEDSFKVMKVQRNSIVVDSDLESLLLGAVDRLRQVLTANRQGTDLDEQWVATVGNPVFEKLHERLGDPVADDAASMLGSEDGTNVVALLFETEVDGCLNRLEAVLADPQAPCLEEELSIMAQELGGLGEMLQLPAFTQLCESVLQHLETAPIMVRETARSALNAWRLAQALVLVGQVSSLPTSISGEPAESISGELVYPELCRRVESISGEPAESIDFSHAAGAPALPRAPQPTPTLAVEVNWMKEGVAAEFDITDNNDSIILPEVISDNVFEERVAHQSEGASGAREVPTDSPLLQDVEPEPMRVEEGSISEVVAAEFDISAHFESPRQSEVAVPLSNDPTIGADDVLEERVAFPSKSTSLSREVQTDLGEVQTTDYRAYGAHKGAPRWREVKTESAVGTQPKESQENSVRIPVRQLDRLNDLFGELTIERNGLGLQLGRLRNLMETLSRRVSTLEQSNKSIRSAYDKVATQSAFPVAGGRPVASAAPNVLDLAPLRPDHNTYGLHSAKEPLHALNAEDRVMGDFSYLGDSNRELGSGFDALEMDRYSDLHLLSQEVMETIVQIQEVTSDIGLTLEDTDSTARELNQTAKQLQTNLTRLRMRPLSDLVGRFSRALRDLSLQHGKLVELKVYGKGTLIDRSILEALGDPLMHLVRNAFDHGVEDPATRSAQGKPPQGVIEIKAAHRGNQTIITVSDDGNGINLNKIRLKAEEMGLDAELLAAASEDELLSLIFEPGFSTADRVTDLSGRGVGMDVVRNNLKLIRGDIRVDTRPALGTTFTLTVPFTLSVARVLLVESNGMQLAFPTDVIEEMLLLGDLKVVPSPMGEVLNWEGEMVPLIRLGSHLAFYCPRRVTLSDGVPTINEPTVLMINQGERVVALAIDRCWGEREVAIRQVEGTMMLPPGFSSCAIKGDGKVVPLVDTVSLLRWIVDMNSVSSSDTPGVTEMSRSGEAYSTTYLKSGPVLTIGQASVTFPTRSGVIKNSMPPKPSFHGSAERDPFVSPNGSPNVLPFEHDIVVSPVLSTKDYSLDARAERDPFVSDATMCESVASKEINTSRSRTILVVDDSINVRRFLALALEKAGYLVLEAKDGQDAVEKLLSGTPVSAVICDIEMPRLDGYGFLARVKSDPKFSNLPIAMLTSRSGDKHRQLAMTLGAVAYFSKPYNERELLTTLLRVITESRAKKPIHAGVG